MDILSVNVCDSQKEKNRILASIIKLSNGNIEKCEYNTKIDSEDIRNIIAWAESPSIFEHPLEFTNMKIEEKEQIMERDWKQYSKWLNK